MENVRNSGKGEENRWAIMHFVKGEYRKKEWWEWRKIIAYTEQKSKHACNLALMFNSTIIGRHNYINRGI